MQLPSDSIAEDLAPASLPDALRGWYPKEVRCILGIMYLIERDHWCITGVEDLSRFFGALVPLAPRGSLIALADGAWPPEVREVLAAAAREPDASALERLADEFRQAAFLPVDDAAMRMLAHLADEHAVPEIALHVTVLNTEGPWLEWFDIAGDPVAISLSRPREAVERFAREAGGVLEEVRTGR